METDFEKMSDEEKLVFLLSEIARNGKRIADTLEAMHRFTVRGYTE